MQHTLSSVPPLQENDFYTSIHEGVSRPKERLSEIGIKISFPLSVIWGVVFLIRRDSSQLLWPNSKTHLWINRRFVNT